MHGALVSSHSAADSPSLKTTQSTFCSQRLSSYSFAEDKILQQIRTLLSLVRNSGSNLAQIVSYDG
jgi:hypothetical protein